MNTLEDEGEIIHEIEESEKFIQVVYELQAKIDIALRVNDIPKSTNTSSTASASFLRNLEATSQSGSRFGTVFEALCMKMAFCLTLTSSTI